MSLALERCILALIEFSDTTHCLLGEKKYVISIFTDFTKAFDMVEHEILLSKSVRYEIRGHVNNSLDLT